MGKNQHVTPKGDGWQVKGEKNTKATKLFSTQKEAIEHAQIIASNQNAEIIIHRPNGQIRHKRIVSNVKKTSIDDYIKENAELKAIIKQLEKDNKALFEKNQQLEELTKQSKNTKKETSKKLEKEETKIKEKKIR